MLHMCNEYIKLELLTFITDSKETFCICKYPYTGISTQVKHPCHHVTCMNTCEGDIMD